MKLIFYKDGALGDIAVLVPLFLQLREQFAPISLTLITNEVFLSPFLEKSGIIDSRISSAAGDIYKIFSETGKSEFLEALSYDRVFFMTKSVSHVYKKSGNSIISPLPTSDHSEFVAFYYIHEVFAQLGTESPTGEWNTVRKRFENIVTAMGIGKNESRERITFHPGSGSWKKNLKASVFLNVLDSMQSGKYQKTLILGPVEMERFHEKDIAQYRKRSDETFISPDIESLIGILIKTKHYFGMDSGVTHLANFLSENVYAFFGPSQPELWSPKSGNIHTVTLATHHFG